jgi:hypothetical protein
MRRLAQSLAVCAYRRVVPQAKGDRGHRESFSFFTFCPTHFAIARTKRSKPKTTL